MNNFELITTLRSMKVGEERMIGKHKIKRVNKHTYNYVCPCCSGRVICYGKD